MVAGAVGGSLPCERQPAMISLSHGFSVRLRWASCPSEPQNRLHSPASSAGTELGNAGRQREKRAVSYIFDT